MFPFLAMVAAAAVMMAMLNALHRFFIPALSPAMFNVATILCAVIAVPLSPQLGIEPIVAIAAGTLAGGLGQILLQWPALRREGFRYHPVLDTRDPWLHEIGRLMVPGVAGLAAVQINLFVNSWLAAGLGTGAVSWLDYAFRLMYMPIGLFGISIATASLPTIAGHAASRNDPGIRRAVSSGLRMMLMLNVPATLGLFVLATPIVRLIFERGRFTAADTAATAAALACYAPGLMGYSAVKLDFAFVLRHGQQPHSCHRERGERCIQHQPEPDSRAIARSSRARVGDCGGSARQRGPAPGIASREAGWPRRETPADRNGENLAGFSCDGARGVLLRTRPAHAVCREWARAYKQSGSSVRSGSVWDRWPSSPISCESKNLPN